MAPPRASPVLADVCQGLPGWGRCAFTRWDVCRIVTAMERFTLEATRGAWVENRHTGIAAWARWGQAPEITAADEPRVFLRSAAKPFQYLAMAAMAQATGRPLTLSTAEIALACGSHAGTTAHVAGVERILAGAGQTPEALACGPDWPLDPTARATCVARGEAPRRLYHNCSGKHATMVLSCVQCGWPIEGYALPDHPLQQGIRAALQRWASLGETLEGTLEGAIDGCGVPTFYLPLPAGARLFAWLASAPEASAARSAMAAFPTMMSGAGRLDDALIRASEGALVSKAGADGVMGVSNIATSEGLLLKIDDGSAQARDMATLRLLVDLGWLRAATCERAPLRPFWVSARENSRGEAIGAYRWSGPAGAQTG